MKTNASAALFSTNFNIHRSASDARVFCSLAAHKHPSHRFISKGCKLVGSGSSVPSLQISNDDLSKIVETNDDWIAVRTGIRNRRVIAGRDTLTGMAVEAAQKALEMAKVRPDEVDLVLMCTSTPEDLFGSAPQIQMALGCKNNPLAYDITAACSGFGLSCLSHQRRRF